MSGESKIPLGFSDEDMAKPEPKRTLKDRWMEICPKWLSLYWWKNQIVAPFRWLVAYHPSSCEVWSLDHDLSLIIYRRLQLFARDDRSIHEWNPGDREKILFMISFFKEYVNHGASGRGWDEAMAPVEYDWSGSEFKLITSEEEADACRAKAKVAEEAFAVRRYRAFNILAEMYPRLWT